METADYPSDNRWDRRASWPVLRHFFLLLLVCQGTIDACPSDGLTLGNRLKCQPGQENDSRAKSKKERPRLASCRNSPQPFPVEGQMNRDQSQKRVSDPHVPGAPFVACHIERDEFRAAGARRQAKRQ